MSLNLSPWIRQQFFDNDGSPLAGGKVYFYVAGSTSLYKNTYADYLGASANTNPVILDSTGIAKIYGAGMYDVRIYDSNDVFLESVIGADFGGDDSTNGTFVVVDNYDALRNLTQDYDIVYVLGRDSAFDGGQGIFEKTTRTDSDDDGIILSRGTSTRYFRVLDDVIKCEWYGVEYSNTVDQSTALLNALDASKTWNLPVLATGSVYISSKTIVKSGTSLNLQGSLVGPSAGITVLFKKGSKFQGYKNCLGTGINPTFEQSVCDALYLSWFTNGTDDSRWSKAAASSVYNYKLNVDIDTTVDTDITVPNNFAVDFVAGSKIIVSSVSNIDIENLIYTGTGQIIKYNDISYIGTVKLGSGYSYLEWFGGLAAADMATNNAIPFLAALKQGNVYLLASAGKFYSVPTGTYTVTNSVAFTGFIPIGANATNINDPANSTIRLEGSVVSTGNLNLSSVRFDGYGSIACANFVSDNSIISNTIAKSTGLSAINDTLTIDPEYLLVGPQGKILLSSNASDWTAETQTASLQFNSIAYNGKTYVAVGNTGAIYTSVDGSTWAAHTMAISNNFYKVRYINSKFIAVGTLGLVAYSTDGITWNTVYPNITDLRDVTYSTITNQYIVVGASANIYVSTDLLTWVKKAVTGFTGTFYSIDTSSTLLVLSGADGTIYVSSDGGATYAPKISGSFSALMTVKYYSTTKIWVLGSSTGEIQTSTDGINWTIVPTNTGLTDVIYDQIQINGKYLFACGSGYLLSTFDLNSFSKTQPATNSLNNLGITGRTGKVIAVGAGGAIKESSDLVTWTAQITGTTADLYAAKLVNGVYYVLGANGTYLTSYDGSIWTVRSIGAAISFYDLEISADKSLYVAVGAAGNIYTSANPIADTPVWTSRISNVTPDLTKVLYSASTWYVYGKTGTILKSTDGSAWTQLNAVTGTNSHNSIATNGTIYVYVGDSGNIESSTDGITYVKRVSNTTVNLLHVTYANGLFVAVGASGTLLTSADGVTWVTRTSGTGNQLNWVVYYGGTFVAVGTSATVVKSTDGVTWVSGVSTYQNKDGNTIAPTTTWRCVEYLNIWILGGDSGSIFYSSDLVTWKQTWDIHVTNPTAFSVRDFGVINNSFVAVCDQGLILHARSTDVPQWLFLAQPVTSKFNRITNDIIVGDFGEMYKLSGGTQVYASACVNPLNSETNDSLIDIVNNNGTWTAISTTGSIRSTDKVNWKSYNYKPVGDIVDVVLTGSTYYILADNRLLSTTDNINFTWIKNVAANHLAYLNSIYYLLEDESTISTEATPTEYGAINQVINSESYSIEGVGSIVLNGATLIYYVTSTGDILIGSVSAIGITATGSAIQYSLLDVPVVNTVAGNVSNSSIISLSKIAKLDDVDVLNLNGDISDNVSRSKIHTNYSISISSNVDFLNTTLTQDKPSTDLLQVASGVTVVSFSDCRLSLNGLMLYSEDTALEISLFGGFLQTSYAISNGFARIYLNNVYDNSGAKIIDTSAYSIDGSIYDDIELAPSEILTASMSGWYHEQIANVTSANNMLTVHTPISLSSTDSTYTLRYRNATTATKLLYELGGHIELQVNFPAGYDKNLQKDIKLRAKLATPVYTITNQMRYGEDWRTIANNTKYVDGNCNYVTTTKDAGKLTAHTYVWSGHRELSLGSQSGTYQGAAHWYDHYGDRYVSTSIKNPMSVTSQVASSEDLNLDIPGIWTHPIYLSGVKTNGSADDPLNHAPYIQIESNSNCVLPAGTTIELTVIPNVTVKNQDIWYGDYIDYMVDAKSGLNYKDLYLVNVDNVLRLVKKIAPNSAIVDESNYLSVKWGTYTYTTGNGMPDTVTDQVLNAYYWVRGGLYRSSVYEPAIIYPALTLVGKTVMIDVEGLLMNAPRTMQSPSNATGVNDAMNYIPKTHIKHIADSQYRILTTTDFEFGQHFQAHL